MENEQKSLLLFQLGPVQEFIAQAATLYDLWAGSYLLSRLTWEAIAAAQKEDAEMIFPDMQSDIVKDALFGDERIPTLPNRFLAKVRPGTEKDVAEKSEQAVRAQLEEWAKELPAGALEQVKQFPQMTWAALPKESVANDMKTNYQVISSVLSARRNLRAFDSWREAVPTGAKDFLSGKETALEKRRGAMNLIKLNLPHKLNLPQWKNKDNVVPAYPDDDKYIAVLAMDGDKMGERLSGLESEDAHRAFSGSLAKFAGEAIRIVRDNGGVPIYAGGDDVLAVFLSKFAICAADRIQSKFKEIVGGTASAGIAVGHEKAPLQELVTHAHAAEHRAKHEYGRDAVAIDVYKRSGETVRWGGKWDTHGLSLLTELREIMKGDGFKRFPYKLAALLRPYELEKMDAKQATGMTGVISAEYNHAWRQCTLRDAEPAALNLVTAYFNEVVDGKASASDFLNVFFCEVFINRPRCANEWED